MIIGYARTSTLDQVAGLEAQVRDLKKEKCDKIFQEHVSSVDAERPQLEAMIEFARDGDVIVCTKLDRLARSVSGMVKIADRLKKKGVSILILDPHLSNRSAAEELTFNLLTSIAQFERQVMLERQREGIAKAKGEGKFKGRAPTVRRRLDEVLMLRANGLSVEKIAEELSKCIDKKTGKPMTVTARSIYRLFAEQRKAMEELEAKGRAA